MRVTRIKELPDQGGCKVHAKLKCSKNHGGAAVQKRTKEGSDPQGMSLTKGLEAETATRPKIQPRLKHRGKDKPLAFPSSSAPWMHGARHSPAAPREDVWASAWQQVFWKLFTHKVLKEADFGSTMSRKSSSKPRLERAKGATIPSCLGPPKSPVGCFGFSRIHVY